MLIYPTDPVEAVTTGRGSIDKNLEVLAENKCNYDTWNS